MFGPLTRISRTKICSIGIAAHGVTYTYDAWGNMQKVPGSPAGENLQHAADEHNHIISYSYDAAGNLLNDGVNGFNYTFDAEYRITNAGSTAYTYDGRVARPSCLFFVPHDTRGCPIVC